MSILVEIVTPTDTLAFYPTPDVNGWVYDNETLDRWYEQADVEAKLNKRPKGHGAFKLGKLYTKEHRPIIVGQFYGNDPVEALEARRRLAAVFNEGEPVTMRVTDELDATTREVRLIGRAAPFHLDFTHFEFDLTFVAEDPRRYGATQSTSDGMPAAASGLYWMLGTAPSGLFFDWGVSAGTLGQVSFTNGGEATTFPRIEVGGAGSFANGFRITEIETGRELTFERGTNTGDVIVFDSRTERATQAAGDVTALLSSREWFAVPAGATRRYQINPLGSITGTPSITIYAAPAYL